MEKADKAAKLAAALAARPNGDPNSEQAALRRIADRIDYWKDKFKAESKDQLVGIAAYGIAMMEIGQDYLVKMTERVKQEQLASDMAMHVVQHLEPLARKTKKLSTTNSAAAKRRRTRDPLSHLIMLAVKQLQEKGTQITDYRVALELGKLSGADNVLRAYTSKDRYGKSLDPTKPHSYIKGSRQKFIVLWRDKKGAPKSSTRHGINERINTAKAKLRT